MAELLDGKKLAAEIRSEIRDEVNEFISRTGSVPQLAGILVGDDPASQIYVRNKEKACLKAEMKSQLHRLPAETTEGELLELVHRLNQDSAVHGILVQLPLPSQINEQSILDAIDPFKDVDAFHPSNVGLMAQGRPRFVPCTPHGCLQMLVRHHIPIAGKHVVVLGRSEIVGKPIATMLSQRDFLYGEQFANATVTLCHSRTANLSDYTRSADVLIAAIGKANFVTGDMVKPGVVAIDVGINRSDTGLVGDLDFESVARQADYITPVPGGVGPMTIAMLLAQHISRGKTKAP